MNKYLVGARGDKIAIQNPPRGDMTRDDALELAAWIVAIADPVGNDFKKKFDEVCES